MNNVSLNIVNCVEKKTTLNPAYRCDDCGKPVGLSCPKCYLKKQGQQIKGLDHAGYYP